MAIKSIIAIREANPTSPIVGSDAGAGAAVTVKGRMPKVTTFLIP